MSFSRTHISLVEDEQFEEEDPETVTEKVLALCSFKSIVPFERLFPADVFKKLRKVKLTVFMCW